MRTDTTINTDTSSIYGRKDTTRSYSSGVLDAAAADDSFKHDKTEVTKAD